jgi:hypothetical protein
VIRINNVRLNCYFHIRRRWIRYVVGKGPFESIETTENVRVTEVTRLKRHKRMRTRIVNLEVLGQYAGSKKAEHGRQEIGQHAVGGREPLQWPSTGTAAPSSPQCKTQQLSSARFANSSSASGLASASLFLTGSP